MLGGIVEHQNYFRYLISQEKTMIVTNKSNPAFISLFRVYAGGVDAEAQYKLELEDPEARMCKTEGF